MYVNTYKLCFYLCREQVPVKDLFVARTEERFFSSERFWLTQKEVGFQK